MAGLVVSDLHLFAGRSDGEILFDGILPRLGTVKILVLNGETFDFRWSHFSSEEESIEAALCWLQKAQEPLSNVGNPLRIGKPRLPHPLSRTNSLTSQIPPSRGSLSSGLPPLPPRRLQQLGDDPGETQAISSGLESGFSEWDVVQEALPTR